MHGDSHIIEKKIEMKIWSLFDIKRKIKIKNNLRTSTANLNITSSNCQTSTAVLLQSFPITASFN